MTLLSRGVGLDALEGAEKDLKRNWMVSVQLRRNGRAGPRDKKGAVNVY